MSREVCPNTEELLLQLRGQSDPRGAAASPATQAHLRRGCAACAQRLGHLRRMLSALSGAPLAEVPDALFLRAAAIAHGARVVDPDAPHTDPARWIGRLAGEVREYVASLLSTPAGTAPVPVLRGELPGGWRRLYRGGPYEIDLGLLEGGALVGQVEAVEAGAPPLAGAWGCLFGADGVREATVEANGDFFFESVRPGSYALSLEAPGARVVLPEVRIGLPESPNGAAGGLTAGT